MNRCAKIVDGFEMVWQGSEYASVQRQILMFGFYISYMHIAPEGTDFYLSSVFHAIWLKTFQAREHITGPLVSTFIFQMKIISPNSLSLTYKKIIPNEMLNTPDRSWDIEKILQNYYFAYFGYDWPCPPKLIILTCRKVWCYLHA